MINIHYFYKNIKNISYLMNKYGLINLNKLNNLLY